jgi:hypothetical protein
VRLHQAKRRAGAAALQLVILLPAVASVAACSLVDGWGGLEGGGTGGHDADGMHDGGGDAPVSIVGPACGGTTCDPTQGKGCCVGPAGGGGTCQTPTACSQPGYNFLLCDDSSECASLGAQATCCDTITTTFTAACTSGACQGVVLCREAGGTCPAGKHCVAGGTGVVPGGYFVCM